MPTPAGPQLRKVTLYLYEADCVALEKHHGYGWTAHVRETTHTHVQAFTNYEIKYRDERRKRTLGDLAND